MKKFKVTVEMPGCLSAEIKKEFTELDATVEIKIPKCTFPVVSLWAQTEIGYTNLMAAPVVIIVEPHPCKTNTLIYKNDNQISGVLILN